MPSMISSIHATIQDYLQEHTAFSLVSTVEFTQPPDKILKIGIVPFIKQGGLKYYFMKPKAAKAELELPDFQICKGTRMHYFEGIGWRDIKAGMPIESQRELLVETAIREGIEELGLKLSNIIKLFDIGVYNFSSASTGALKQMWIFAAEVNDVNDFLPENEIEDKTAERAWLTAIDFATAGRIDHKPIVADIDKRLSRLLVR